MKNDEITLTINDEPVVFVRKDSIQTTGDIGTKRIIVADRGWVFVGDCEDHTDGSVTIRNTKNIRRWGTTAGLGELVNGPTANTKSDAYGNVRVTPIVQIDVVRGW
jgi:hypothetical protein